MGEPTPSVVVVEDDRQIRRFVRSTLEAERCRRAGGVPSGTRLAGARST